MHLLWSKPESPVFYYFSTDATSERTLQEAESRGEIVAKEMKRHYYKYPKEERNFIHIPECEGKYTWEWQREMVENGQEYWQVRLELTAAKRRELDALQKIQLEEAFREEIRRAANAFDVFLSYAEADREEAKLIHDKLEAAGARVFMAPKNIAPGDDFAERIRVALEGANEVWLLVSPASAKSEWVISEWGAAWILRKRIVPILHRCAPDSLPDRLRRLQCIDLHKCDVLIEATFGKLKQRSAVDSAGANNRKVPMQ